MTVGSSFVQMVSLVKQNKSVRHKATGRQTVEGTDLRTDGRTNGVTNRPNETYLAIIRLPKWFNTTLYL